jgi:N utilization substance protein A
LGLVFSRNAAFRDRIFKVKGVTIMVARNRHRDELGPDSAGQSGDIQQISDAAGADSESVEELVEEGNAFEADAVAGVESADDLDVSEVRTHQVPEDDVPAEYRDDDEHVA